MEVSRKSIISVFEITMLLVMFSSYSTFLFEDIKVSPSDHSFQINSLADSIVYSENFRTVIQEENLSSEAITGNWTSLESMLNKTVSSYGLVISNSTTEKVIESCNHVFYHESTERIVAINDSENYEFRKMRLSVCY